MKCTVQDSNLRSTKQEILSLAPLAAWVTVRVVRMIAQEVLSLHGGPSVARDVVFSP